MDSLESSFSWFSAVTSSSLLDVSSSSSVSIILGKLSRILFTAGVVAPEGTSLFLFDEDFLGAAIEVEEGGDPGDFPLDTH